MDDVRIVVAGGHSAGHIEPTMNFADAVKRLEPGVQVTALGTVRGLDTTLIPQRGYPLELIPPVPFQRKLDKAFFQIPGRLRGSVAAAQAVLEKTNAEILVGFGGYVALPGYLAARRLGIPFVIHEANARPGVANKIAARFTRHIYTASAAVRLPHATPIGIPLRPAIATLDRAALRAEARARFDLAEDGPVLMVTGGSQGAQAINAAVAGAAGALRAAGIQVLHIAGPKNYEDIAARITHPDVAPVFRVLPYVDEMQYAYAASDFVICRSGAMTVAELTAVGLPAAYVPLPLRGGEQRTNALPIIHAGGAIMIDNAALDADWVAAELVPRLTDPEVLAGMAGAAEHAGARDADVVLARAVLKIVADRRAA
ncbi:MAG TPA: UDP-N-acetylglucosamine--N-acetylmuramyl-(pentapeptide) pyrophosphoryl-undecaprenol N-acetylglucosamine transferase [Jatrophihabitans sp.]|jgi:UDP-N-acetylglucosamine--N-acetylmuramyl-(pentapeptide) pyrophosphoryl-undecaprenol N-acetylglucosamine transferase